MRHTAISLTQHTLIRLLPLRVIILHFIGIYTAYIATGYQHAIVTLLSLFTLFQISPVAIAISGYCHTLPLLLLAVTGISHVITFGYAIVYFTLPLHVHCYIAILLFAIAIHCHCHRLSDKVIATLSVIVISPFHVIGLLYIATLSPRSYAITMAIAGRYAIAIADGYR
jgi:hypothetical protein